MIASLLRSQTAIHTSIIITRAFVAMRNYIMASTSFSAELEAIKAKLELLERNDEDNLAAINDLSEDMRQEIDNLYLAIAELSSRLEEMKNELTYLKTVREKEVAELIKEARSYGDLSETSEYDEAKDEQGRVYSALPSWRTFCPTAW